MESIRTAKLSGFHVCVETPIFANMGADEFRSMANFITTLDVDGWIQKRPAVSQAGQPSEEALAAARELIPNSGWKSFSKHLTLAAPHAEFAGGEVGDAASYPGNKTRRSNQSGIDSPRRKRARIMTTLVTGAAGFLGSHVARQLVAAGENVRVLVRASSSNRAIADLPLEYVTGDLRDQASLQRAMQGVQKVFHVAADYRLWAKNPQDIYDSNVGGTKNLLAAAKQAGIERLIYTSTVATIAVDRPPLPNEFTDSKLDEMVGHYKRSKWMAEQEVLQAAKDGLPVVVAMPTTPVGPWDWKPTPTGKIIVDFLNGKMPGYVETGLNFVGVEDCAAGHLLLAEKGKIGERYLLGAENLTLKQVLDSLAQLTGLPAPKLKIPHALALGVAYAETAFSRLIGREPQIPVEGVKIAQHLMFVDCQRAQQELGFQARTGGRGVRTRGALVRKKWLRKRAAHQTYGPRGGGVA